MTRLYRQNRFEFGVAIGTFAAVVALGILVGILTAVFLSLALLIARISRPSHAVLEHGRRRRRLPRTPDGRALRSGSRRGGLLAAMPRLFFANADDFVGQAIQLLHRPDPERFVLDFEAVPLVDATAARALRRLLSTVKSRDAELSVARGSRALHHQTDVAGLVEAIGESRLPFWQGGRSRGRHAQPALAATSGGR